MDLSPRAQLERSLTGRMSRMTNARPGLRFRLGKLFGGAGEGAGRWLIFGVDDSYPDFFLSPKAWTWLESSLNWDHLVPYAGEPVVEIPFRCTGSQVKSPVQRRLRERMFLTAGARRSSTGQQCVTPDT
jgi:hypothetical protein